MADFNGVKFPIDPMIGVIGTAPDGEDVIDGFVGAHGGNLDNKLITKGTRMYFPVRVPGALLQMGVVLSLPVLRCYNGQRGRDPRVNRVMKWLFYLYYPLHLLLIGLLSN